MLFETLIAALSSNSKLLKQAFKSTPPPPQGLTDLFLWNRTGPLFCGVKWGLGGGKHSLQWKHYRKRLVGFPTESSGKREQMRRGKNKGSCSKPLMKTNLKQMNKWWEKTTCCITKRVCVSLHTPQWFPTQRETCPFTTKKRMRPLQETLQWGWRIELRNSLSSRS